MQTYQNKLHKNLSVNGSILNYVMLPIPIGVVFDDIINEVGREYGVDAKATVAKVQAELVAEAISKITGKPFAFISASVQRPMLFDGDEDRHGASFVIVSVDTVDLPSVSQTATHYTGFDFTKIMLESAQFLYEQKPKIVPLLTTENMHKPFIEWGKYLVQVYLSTIMICDNAGEVLDDDKNLNDIMTANLRKRLNLEQLSDI